MAQQSCLQERFLCPLCLTRVFSEVTGLWLSLLHFLDTQASSQRHQSMFGCWLSSGPSPLTAKPPHTWRGLNGPLTQLNLYNTPSFPKLRWTAKGFTVVANQGTYPQRAQNRNPVGHLTVDSGSSLGFLPQRTVSEQ